MSLRSISPADFAALMSHVWIFTGGALITLLISIFDVARRSAAKLIAGCILGGIGAWLVGTMLEGSDWQLPAAGIAAIMTENIAMGFVKASKDFRDNPFEVITRLITSIIPGLNGLKK